MNRGFEQEPFLAAVEDANWQMVGEIIARTPEDKAMLGWAAANILSNELNFRIGAAMCFEATPTELEPDVVVDLQKALDMEDNDDNTIRARYYAAKALLEHDEMSPGVSATIEQTSICDDPDLAGLAIECMSVVEKLKKQNSEA